MSAKPQTTQAAARGNMDMRTAHRCPNCGSACCLRNSYPTETGETKLWLLCLNERCVWSGVATATLIRTVRPANTNKRPVNTDFKNITRARMVMRASHYCPECKSLCAAVNSFKVSNLSRENIFACSNLDCGWRGAINTEITNTVTMPHPAYVKNPNLPPLLPESELMAPRQTHQTAELFE